MVLKHEMEIAILDARNNNTNHLFILQVDNLIEGLKQIITNPYKRIGI
jgi:hypothetical protein